MHPWPNAIAYLENKPFILFNSLISADLEIVGWNKFNRFTGKQGLSYNITNCLRYLDAASGNITKLLSLNEEDFVVELPNKSLLHNFYEEHGLEPLSEEEIQTHQIIEKLQHALKLLSIDKEIFASVKSLVKSFQILKQQDVEIDTSYSHPNIPFSIFISVCEDSSIISSLRVAESILHEAMHLQLTLLEDVIELVRSDSINLYYSPWRGEDRPIRGVLHGLYVFRAIHNFYTIFSRHQNHPDIVADFIEYRIESIVEEIGLLKKFSQVPDLTKDGRLLVEQLFVL